MSENATLYRDVVLEALTEQPWEIDGSVYTDRLEGCAGVAGEWKFRFSKDTELYHRQCKLTT